MTQLGRPRPRLEDDIKDKSGSGHIQLAGTVNKVINLQVPQYARNLPTSWGTTKFSRRILFHGVSDIPTEISHTVEVHMICTSRSLTDWNNLRCRGGYDLSWLDVILFASWGLCPNALHGASSRILSNDSGLNGGPWSTNLCRSCGSCGPVIMWTLFVESHTKNSLWDYYEVPVYSDQHWRKTIYFGKHLLHTSNIKLKEFRWAGADTERAEGANEHGDLHTTSEGATLGLHWADGTLGNALHVPKLRWHSCLNKWEQDKSKMFYRST